MNTGETRLLRVETVADLPVDGRQLYIPSDDN